MIYKDPKKKTLREYIDENSDLSNYYNKSQVEDLIPEVPTDISELTDTEGLLNQSSSGLTQQQIEGLI